jgi:hypothetical protein
MTPEERRLNRRIDDLEAALGNLTLDTGSGAVTYLARTKKVTTYPTTAGAYYAVDLVYLTAPEVEGGGDNPQSLGAPTQYAYNFGQAVPYEGQLVEVTRVPSGRWEFLQPPGDGGLLVATHENPSTTLKVDISAGYFVNTSNVDTFYPGTGTSPLTLTAFSTVKVYLDNTGTPQTTTAASYPPGVVRLATVQTGVSSVTKVLGDDRTFRTACLET